MKQISASAQAGATVDQASDGTAQTQARRDPFELNITEEPPTAEQVQTILEYVGKENIHKVIKDADNEQDALEKFRASRDSFLRPLVRFASFFVPDSSTLGLPSAPNCMMDQLEYKASGTMEQCAH